MEIKSKGDIFDSDIDYVGKEYYYSCNDGTDETKAVLIYSTSTGDLDFSFTVTPTLRQNATTNGNLTVMLIINTEGEEVRSLQWNYSLSIGNYLIYTFMDSKTDESEVKLFTELSPITFSTDELY